MKKIILLFGLLTLTALPLAAQMTVQQKKPCTWEKTTLTFGLDVPIERCYASMADKVGTLQTITTQAGHGVNRTGVAYTSVDYTLEFSDSTIVGKDRKRPGRAPVWFSVEVVRFDNSDAVTVDSLESVGDQNNDWVKGYAGWHVESDKHFNHDGIEWLPARQIVYSNATGDPKTDYMAYWVTYRFIVDTRHKTAYILSTDFCVPLMYNEPALVTNYWFDGFVVKE